MPRLRREGVEPGRRSGPFPVKSACRGTTDPIQVSRRAHPRDPRNTGPFACSDANRGVWGRGSARFHSRGEGGWDFPPPRTSRPRDVDAAGTRKSDWRYRHEGASARPISPPGPDRVRRHGRDLSGQDLRRAAPRTHGGSEANPQPPGARRGVHQDARGRGPHRQPHGAREHREDLRVLPRPRRVLHRHGVRGRQGWADLARPLSGPAALDSAGAVRVHHDERPAGAGPSPSPDRSRRCPAESHPPGREPLQCHLLLLRRGEAVRFRDCQGLPELGADPLWCNQGQGQVHEPRAGPGQAAGSTQ